MRFGALIVGILAGFAVFELACQLYWLQVERGFDIIRVRDDFYYEMSEAPRLAYELRPGFRFTRDHKRISSDDRGFRTDPQPVERIGVIGDSVVFGVGHSQESTPTALAGPGYLNLGVPGYGLAEIAAFLERSTSRVDLEGVVYVLNLNDFALRDTRYEGADNGLYRMFVPPGLKTRYFLGKAAYRYRKSGSGWKSSAQTAGWYRWLFAGTGETNLDHLAKMIEFAQTNATRFAVLVLPAGGGYSGEGYTLGDITDSVCSLSKQHRTPCRQAFAGRSPTELFDATDHLTQEGNRALADEIVELTRDWL